MILSPIAGVMEHFMPFTIISKVLSKIEAEIVTGVLIVPLFTTQSCLKQLLRLLVFSIQEKDIANLSKCSLDSMSHVRKLYKDKGISDEIAETIIQSCRPNIKCKYDTYRKQWLQFCSERICDPMCLTLVTVIVSLHVLRKKI